MFAFNLYYQVLIILFIVVICLLSLLYIFLLITNKKRVIIRFEDEKYFKNPSKEPFTRQPFPSPEDPPSVQLSVIIPAYNEEIRLPSMLTECLDYLEGRCQKNPKFTYEVIVVDDGSRDRTSEIALNYAKKIGVEKLRVLTLLKNRGKGGAVRLGMLSARGTYLLFADADGATKFSDIEKLEDAMKVLCNINEESIVIGSRAHLEKESVATRSIFRTFLMYGFHTLVLLFGVRHVRDTQCGFKLFTRKSALQLFSLLHVERWAFDVEILYIAHRLKMEIREVSVNWTEIEGSKLVPFWSWLQMGKDLILIWLKYQTRLWTIDVEKNK